MPCAKRITAAMAAAVSLTVAGCSGPVSPGAPSAERAGCITDFDPAADYFPDKSEITEAANFRIDYRGSYQILTVQRPHPGGNPVSYILVRCGAPDPALTGDLANAQHVTVPVRSLYSGSTTQLALITQLGAADVVTGVGDRAGVTDPQIRRRIDDGAVTGYAPGGQLNVETVIGAAPDVVVGGDLGAPGYPRLRESGIPLVANAEWLEPTPLGRAEWVKVFAALTGTERTAATVYAGIRDNYRSIAEKASATTPVDVLTGTMYSGSWFMPTGGGYAGRLIADAGGSYPWLAEGGAESRQLNFETVYAQAGTAPLWLVSSDWETVAEAVAHDNRYAELAAVRTGQVWSTTKPYWELGVARPDLILRDLVAILHPELEPGHTFEFYRRVR